ncbi:MAG TPA: hypothetical protein VN875_09160 [Candidatus Binatus sp.]|nr:hypothetical protein [Candidatus Binatus sp.]
MKNDMELEQTKKVLDACHAHEYGPEVVNCRNCGVGICVTRAPYDYCDSGMCNLMCEVEVLFHAAHQECEYRIRSWPKPPAKHNCYRIVGERNEVVLDNASREHVLTFMREEIQRRQGAEDKAVRA